MKRTGSSSDLHPSVAGRIAVNLTKKAGSLPEYPQRYPSVYVCPSCGFLSNERLIFCARCGKRLQGADDPRPVADPVRERRRVRLLYTWLGVWVLALAGAVTYTVSYDPTAGHAGRVVYGDETLLESAGRDASIWCVALRAMKFS